MVLFSRFIQQALLQALLDPSKLIRNTSSICIATMTRAGGLACWFKTDLNLTQVNGASVALILSSCLVFVPTAGLW